MTRIGTDAAGLVLTIDLGALADNWSATRGAFQARRMCRGRQGRRLRDRHRKGSAGAVGRRVPDFLRRRPRRRCARSPGRPRCHDLYPEQLRACLGGDLPRVRSQAGARQLPRDRSLGGQCSRRAFGDPGRYRAEPTGTVAARSAGAGAPPGSAQSGIAAADHEPLRLRGRAGPSDEPVAARPLPARYAGSSRGFRRRSRTPPASISVPTRFSIWCGRESRSMAPSSSGRSRRLRPSSQQRLASCRSATRRKARRSATAPASALKKTCGSPFFAPDTPMDITGSRDRATRGAADRFWCAEGWRASWDAFRWI